MKSIMPFARESSNIVKLEVKGETETEWGELTLTSRAEDVGSNVSTLEVEVDGSENDIIFNAKYLEDVLRSLKCKRVALEMQYDTRPGVIKPMKQVGGKWYVDDEMNYTCVIMPLSVNR
jgi:DNA polymerase-3 subunit beta